MAKGKKAAKKATRKKKPLARSKMKKLRGGMGDGSTRFKPTTGYGGDEVDPLK